VAALEVAEALGILFTWCPVEGREEPGLAQSGQETTASDGSSSSVVRYARQPRSPAVCLRPHSTQTSPPAARSSTTEPSLGCPVPGLVALAYAKSGSANLSTISSSASCAGTTPSPSFSWPGGACAPPLPLAGPVSAHHECARGAGARARGSRARRSGLAVWCCAGGGRAVGGGRRLGTALRQEAGVEHSDAEDNQRQPCIGALVREAEHKR
jgi:hypothetical protein